MMVGMRTWLLLAGALLSDAATCEGSSAASCLVAQDDSSAMLQRHEGSERKRPAAVGWVEPDEPKAAAEKRSWQAARKQAKVGSHAARPAWKRLAPKNFGPPAGSWAAAAPEQAAMLEHASPWWGKQGAAGAVPDAAAKWKQAAEEKKRAWQPFWKQMKDRWAAKKQTARAAWKSLAPKSKGPSLAEQEEEATAMLQQQPGAAPLWSQPAGATAQHHEAPWWAAAPGASAARAAPRRAQLPPAAPKSAAQPAPWWAAVASKKQAARAAPRQAAQPAPWWAQHETGKDAAQSGPHAAPWRAQHKTEGVKAHTAWKVAPHHAAPSHASLAAAAPWWGRQGAAGAGAVPAAAAKWKQAVEEKKKAWQPLWKQMKDRMAAKKQAAGVAWKNLAPKNNLPR